MGSVSSESEIRVHQDIVFLLWKLNWIVKTKEPVPMTSYSTQPVCREALLNKPTSCKSKIAEPQYDENPKPHSTKILITEVSRTLSSKPSRQSPTHS